MKRTVVGFTAVATLGLAVYLGSQVWAQVAAPPAAQPAAQPRALQTRIGLVNMVQVLKEYKKFQAIEAPIRTRSAEWDKKLNDFRTRLIKLKEEYNAPATPQARKEQIEKESRQIQLEAQSAEEDAKKELGKMQGEAAVQIFREVKACVDRFAQAYGYEAIFFYNDAISPEDMMQPAVIQRKLMNPASLMPLYYAPGMDISASIVSTLNASYAPATPPPAAPAGGAPAH